MQKKSLKNEVDRFNSSLDKAEVRITVLEDRSKEIVQNAVQRDKEIKSRQEKLHWNSKRHETKKGQYLKGLMAKNFSELKNR